jgi:hypothetical protein
MKNSHQNMKKHLTSPYHGLRKNYLEKNIDEVVSGTCHVSDRWFNY